MTSPDRAVERLLVGAIESAPNLSDRALLDALGSYWSLYLSSTVVGAAAVALALALRPPLPVRALASH